MNKVIFCGRTTKDIEMRYSQGENSMAIGRFSIAIDSGYGDIFLRTLQVFQTQYS